MNKRELANLILGTALIVIFSAALILVIHRVQTSDLAALGYQFDFYADHHSQYNPQLYINHTEGQPGSYFRITGYGYPAYSQAAIMVNGRYLAGVTVDGYGYFVFQFNTDQADDGLYVIVVSVNPGAATQFTLDSSSPNLWPEEFGEVFSMPEGIALTKFIYLPVILSQ
jgi:hypothetical protein